MKRLFDQFQLCILVLFVVGFSACQPVVKEPCTGIEGAVKYEVENLENRLRTGLYEQKIQNLIVIVDDTTSMEDCFNGREKRNRANDILKRITATIPHIELDQGIRIYGPHVNSHQKDSSLSHGKTFIPTDSIREKILTKTIDDSMFNPLADALEGVYHELKIVKGDSALIVVSDFSDPQKELIRSAQYIREYYQDRLCVYPIVIGEDGPGRNSAEDVVSEIGCGIAAMESSLVSGANLADFMEKVLFTKVEPLSPLKPFIQEPKEELSYAKFVKEKKLTIELKTQFDFDKSTIRPEYMAHLQEIAQFMETYPDTVTTIEGHTCSIGTEEYNMKLSQRRAMSVQKHLMSLGVDPARLHTASYGETQPVTDNSTPEGRKKNRRAVAVITATVKDYMKQKK